MRIGSGEKCKINFPVHIVDVVPLAEPDPGVVVFADNPNFCFAWSIPAKLIEEFDMYRRQEDELWMMPLGCSVIFDEDK